MYVNKTFLIGNIGKNPDVTHLDNGKVVAKFSLATTEKYKNKSGDMVENTSWHNIVVWGNSATFIETHVPKGSLAYVEGKIQYKTYTKDGIEKHYTEILCEDFQLLKKGE